jgi:hypothetical protein
MKKGRLILTNLTMIGWCTAVHADTSNFSVNVPEPATIVLLGLVLVGFGVYGLYRRKKKPPK